MKKVFSRTMSLCPICNDKVDTRIIEENKKVFLEKFCKKDGVSKALICSDSNWYSESLKYIKPGTKPNKIKINTFKKCPDSCGLCPNHKQHTCLPIIEITNRCNLKCPICLKTWNRDFDITTKQFTGILDNLLQCEDNISVINLSGGEPTLHPDFEKIIKICREKGVIQTTVSTNGISILKDKKLRAFIKENNVLVALQFDGFIPKTYKYLRGKDLSSNKMQILDLLEKEKIRYSLVSTIVRGLNDNEITKISDYFFKSNAVSLMYQPITFTGKACTLFSDDKRITIPDVVKELEKSSFIKKGDFIPLPCSSPTCFALSYYFILEDKKFISMKELLGIDNYLDVISNRTLPGLDSSSFKIIKERIYDFWSASDQFNNSQLILKRIRNILKELNENKFFSKKVFDIGIKTMKAVFIHQFMDKYTLDFSRLMKCCNHYPQVDGRLMPACAQNIFFQ